MKLSQSLNKQQIFGLLILLSIIFFGCKSKLPIEKDLSNNKFSMLNQDSISVIFPGDLNGKIVVMGFIFTHCPDICPLTTNNMYRIQQRLEQENIPNVYFVSLTFDPLRDSPSILKQYAEIREIDTKGWEFLTASQNIIDSLKNELSFLAVAGDTTYTKNGKPNYYFIHTDRISLIDENGRLRKNYKGSEIDIEEIIMDIKKING